MTIPTVCAICQYREVPADRSVCNVCMPQAPEYAQLADRIKELERVGGDLLRLVDAHAAEINRRRGAMSVVRDALDEAGVPGMHTGANLTLCQRVEWLAAERNALLEVCELLAAWRRPSARDWSNGACQDEFDIMREKAKAALLKAKGAN